MLAEPQPNGDPRIAEVSRLLAEFAGKKVGATGIALAAGGIHTAMAALVAARRSGALKVRRDHIAWTDKERPVVDGLRRLAAAGESLDVQRWRKAWAELPSRAVEMLVAEAGGYSAFAKLPWLIASRPFGIPGPEGVTPLLAGAISYASKERRPEEVLRDHAALAILRAAAAVLEQPEVPPPGWSQPTSAFRMLVRNIEVAYAVTPPEEAESRLPPVERIGRRAAGLDQNGARRSALRIDSTSTLMRLVSREWPK
ncbi:hypothetical protein V5F79_00155 [Xanthobacter flavus]|uniref:hypothetical protein n=1 Tax=Xanthobacter flavus TaxID=281 RepID=UPI003727E91F